MHGIMIYTIAIVVLYVGQRVYTTLVYNSGTVYIITCHNVLQTQQFTSQQEDARSLLEEEQGKTEQLSSEVLSLTQGMVQYKTTLEAIQQKRSALNARVEELAQEKADILREKVSLGVQVASLEDSLKATRKQLSVMTTERERLEERVTHSDKRIFLAELNRSIVSRESSSLNVSSDSLKETLRAILPETDEACKGQYERLLEEYGPLCDTLAQMRKKETELQEEMEKSCSRYEEQLQMIQEEHSKRLADIRKQHEETHKTWRNETDTLRQSVREQQQKMQSQLKDAQFEAAIKSKAEHVNEHSKWERDMNALRNELLVERQRVLEANENLKHLSTRHSEQLASCQHRLKEVQKERERLQDSSILLQRANEELSGRVTIAEDRSKALEQSLGSATRDLEQCHHQVREREIEMERWQQSQQEKSKQLAVLETRVAESQRWTEELQREKENMETALHTAQSECASLEGHCLAIKTQLSSTTAELEAAQASRGEVESEYKKLVESIEQILELGSQNPLHIVNSSTLTPTVKTVPQTMLCQSLLQLKTERDTLREKGREDCETLEQLKKNVECTTKQKTEAEAHVKALQLSLTSLQTRFDAVSCQCTTSETQVKEMKVCLDALDMEKRELKLQNGSLQRQLHALQPTVDGLEKNCATLQEGLTVAETAKKACSEELQQLTSLVSVMKSTHINKDRKMAEMEERLKTAQRELLDREVSYKSDERSKVALDQRLAEFEQRNMKHESTKRELQSRVQYLEAQLTEISQKTLVLKRDVEQLQTEKQELIGDVERLSEHLKVTTQEKQALSQSQEREIERLRSEIERKLHENSTLKLQLVHSIPARQL